MPDVTSSAPADTSDDTQDEFEPGKDPRRWKILVVSQLAGFMSLLDVSVVNVALPSIQRGLHTTPADIQWIVSGYALTFGLALVPGGRLGDALGRRTMFMVALSAFMLTSLLVGLAPTTELVVLGRLLQGFAGGLLTPQNSGLIQDLFRGPERGRAFGVFGATVGISTAVGPLAGGLILAAFGEQTGWRWVFLLNVPIGLVALAMAARLLPRARPESEGPLRSRLDFVGGALLGLGVLAVLLPLVETDSGGLRKLWWLFPVGVLLFAAFAWWEHRTVHRGRPPVLDPRLLTETPGYPTGAVVGILYFIGFSGIWLVLALFLQNGLGYSPLHSGVAVTPFAIGSAAAAAVGGRLVSRLGRRLTVVGLTLVAVGLAGTAVAFGTVSGDGALAAALVPLLIGGIGGGLVISPNITLTLESVPVRMAGAAGGALQTGQRIGSAIGTAVLASVFYGQLSGSQDYHRAIATALAAAAGCILLALVPAIWDVHRHRSQPVS